MKRVEPSDEMASLRDTLSSVPQKVLFIGMFGFIRYSGAVLDALIQYERQAAKQPPDSAPARFAGWPCDVLVLVDETRTFLRRLGEATNREARRIEHDLELLGETIGRACEQELRSDTRYVRRHEVKP